MKNVTTSHTITLDEVITKLPIRSSLKLFISYIIDNKQISTCSKENIPDILEIKI